MQVQFDIVIFLLGVVECGEGDVMMKEKIQQMFEQFDLIEYDVEVKECWGDMDVYCQSVEWMVCYIFVDCECMNVEGVELYVCYVVLLDVGIFVDSFEVVVVVEVQCVYFNWWFYDCLFDMLWMVLYYWVDDLCFMVNID